MGQIQDHPARFHGPQQRFAEFGQAALGAGAVGVGADAVVGETDHAQAVLPPGLDLLGPDDRVSPLHGEDESQWFGAASLLPGAGVLIEGSGVADDADFPLAFEHAVVGELALGAGVGDLLTGRTGRGTAGTGGARDDGDHGDEQFGPAHLREGGGVASPALLGHAGLGPADLGHAQIQVAVPLQGVHGQVEVGVDHQHGIFPFIRCVFSPGLRICRLNPHRSPPPISRV